MAAPKKPFLPTVRRELTALVDELDARGLSILTCITREHVHGTDAWMVFRDLDHNEITRIPAKDVGVRDPRQAILDMLGLSCSICGARLLDTEESICGTCEAQEVMGLLRLRSTLE